MLKWMGSMLLLCGCVGAGLVRVRNMEKRVNTIRNLLCAFEIMGRELSFRVPLLEEMLLAAEKSVVDPTRSFLAACRERLERSEDTPFSEIWDNAANEKLFHIKNRDLSAVYLLGGILGKYDCEGQKVAIEQVCAELRRVLSEAMIERKNMGRVYGVLGTTIGAFLVILFL